MPRQPHRKKRDWPGAWLAVGQFGKLSPVDALQLAEELREELSDLIEGAPATLNSLQGAAPRLPSCPPPSVAVLRHVVHLAHMSDLGQQLGRLLREKGVSDTAALRRLCNLTLPFLCALLGGGRTAADGSSSDSRADHVALLLQEAGVLSVAVEGLTRLASLTLKQRLHAHFSTCVGLASLLLDCHHSHEQARLARAAISVGAAAVTAAPAEDFRLQVSLLPGLRAALTHWLRGAPHWLRVHVPDPADSNGVAVAAALTCSSWNACVAAADLLYIAFAQTPAKQLADLQRDLCSARILEGLTAALTVCHAARRAGQRRQLMQQLVGSFDEATLPQELFTLSLNHTWGQLCCVLCKLCHAMVVTLPTLQQQQQQPDDEAPGRGSASPVPLYVLQVPHGAAGGMRGLLLAMIEQITLPKDAGAASPVAWKSRGGGSLSDGGGWSANGSSGGGGDGRGGGGAGSDAGGGGGDNGRGGDGGQADAAYEFTFLVNELAHLMQQSPAVPEDMLTWLRTTQLLDAAGCLELLPACVWVVEAAAPGEVFATEGGQPPTPPAELRRWRGLVAVRRAGLAKQQLAVCRSLIAQGAEAAAAAVGAAAATAAVVFPALGASAQTSLTPAAAAAVAAETADAPPRGGLCAGTDASFGHEGLACHGDERPVLQRNPARGMGQAAVPAAAPTLEGAAAQLLCATAAAAGSGGTAGDGGTAGGGTGYSGTGDVGRGGGGTGERESIGGRTGCSTGDGVSGDGKSGDGRAGDGGTPCCGTGADGCGGGETLTGGGSDGGSVNADTARERQSVEAAVVGQWLGVMHAGLLERTQVLQHCAACQARPLLDGGAMRLQACSECGVAHYCGRTCQRAHWRIHKGECEGLARAAQALRLRRVALEEAGGGGAEGSCRVSQRASAEEWADWACGMMELGGDNA